MSSKKTLQCLSAPRNRYAPAEARAPLTAEEKKDKRATSKENQEKIDAAVGEWWAYTNAKAIELSEQFDKKPRYFLDIFFQGGAHMVNHNEKSNPYNAFKSEKAAERRDEGSTGMNACELHDEYKDEYYALDEMEKAELVKRFDEAKEDTPKIRRDTPRARIADVSNTVRNIQMLFHGLSYRVGIEGFFCIVRNTPDFYMVPQWYFTSKELERYMPIAVRRKWDTSETGTRLEAFAIAGCDTMNLLRTTKQKVDYLKGEIRDRVLSGLVHETGKANIRMDYVYNEESIVLKYGVDLVGWTCERFVNPSELSSSISVLTTLRDALRDGDCKWVKLTITERKTRKEKWKADVAAGKVIARIRNVRSDIGKKRTAAAMDDDGDGDQGQEEPLASSALANAPIIEEPDTDVTPASAATVAPAPKRRRVAKATDTGTKAADTVGKPRPKPRTKAVQKIKASGTGKGARDDAVTRAAADRLRRRAVKSRALLSDDDDTDTGGAVGINGVPPLAATMVIDPSLVNTST